MAQWSEEKKNTRRLIDDKINQIVSIRNKEAGVSSGDISVYKEGMSQQELSAEIRARSNQIRQDLFRESVVLVDLQRAFHAFEV